VIGLSFTWLCGDVPTTASIITNAAGQGGATVPVKRNRFSVQRSSLISQGSIGEPGFKSTKGPVKVTARFNGRTWSGTFSGKGPCSSGNLTFSSLTRA
jgi:hypothetical protein